MPAGPDPAGSDAFFAEVYQELRALAHARMRGERSGQTIQSTELVHEAYLRLGPRDGSVWQSRREFFAAAAVAMRRILIERARARGRVKRGGDTEGRPPHKISLDLSQVAAIADDGDPETILALDRAIEQLAERDARAAQVVRLRFYGGLSVEEVVETLQSSRRTVMRDWAFARTWLYGKLSRG
jgi:RNA polymerase sigma factor (TIGR02999 family)